MISCAAARASASDIRAAPPRARADPPAIYHHAY
jgi:hypothetical protein